MRLIDADNLKIPNDAPYKASVKRVVAQQPTVEAIPVVHGKWENVGDSEEDLCFRCSNCKEEFSCEIDMNTFANFCPNCGADMRTSAE